MTEQKDNAGMKTQGSVEIRDPDTGQLLLKKSFASKEKK